MWIAYVRDTQSINIAKLTPKNIQSDVEYFVVRSNFTKGTILLKVTTEDQTNKYYSPRPLSDGDLQLFKLKEMNSLNLIMRGDV